MVRLTCMRQPAEPLEHAWRRLSGPVQAWQDSRRRFVHIEARTCSTCRRISQASPCSTCHGSGFEALEEIDRAYPSSHDACAFFAGSADRVLGAEERARKLARAMQAGGNLAAVPDRVRWKAASERPYGTVALEESELAKRIGDVDPI